VNYEQDDIASSEMMKKLKDDLQNKLNKAKIQIQSLEAELKKNQRVKAIESGDSQNELEGKFKMQREMAIFLQKQLKTKEEEIETIKNEAVQIKTKYRQLESQLRLKEEKLNDFQRQLDNLNIQTQVPNMREDPNLDLRIRELKNKIENLLKRNNEQKIEITQLRKRV
jgi:chromosome segregation ATPase